jgi:hypothetical protein
VPGEDIGLDLDLPDVRGHRFVAPTLLLAPASNHRFLA